ncbi:MAG: arsenosugar biosynthesis radical SAM protein ArsS [Magnetococcus sp. YQC-5]
MNNFLHNVAQHTGSAELRSRSLATIQVNLGPQCSLECRHCHLTASPKRQEAMSQTIMDRILDQLSHMTCQRVDITGGAPELHPLFGQFITRLHARKINIQVRTNLAIYLEPGMDQLLQMLKACHVSLVGSLPCYLEKNVDAQRGPGTFTKTIAAIRMLNTQGYGIHPQWPLDLVYNPQGPSLPPDQHRLEATYRQILQEQYGLFFTRLLTITNMPIGRFKADLMRQGTQKAYMTLLQQAFNPHTLDKLMCRDQISIRWDGRLYDCDFNLALDLPVQATHTDVDTLSDALAFRPIVTGNHCLACSAGSGSSCSGALTA